MTPYKWSTTQVMQATGGSLLSGGMNTDYGGVGIDSRTIETGQLFVAIAGDAHDGHRFVTDVLDRGVKGVVVDAAKTGALPLDRMNDEGVDCVAVPDTTKALADLARFNRNRGDLKVLAVTGSNGKTSTRILMSLVISKAFATLSTSGNLNNHIGLPLTLLQLSSSHRAAVLEMGMNHAGEIDCLGKVCEPDIGIINNVGPAHLEGLGSLENIARAKGELLHTLRAGGTAVLNLDDPLVADLATTVEHTILFFGEDPKAKVRAENVALSDAETTFTLITPSGRTPVTLATPARVMVSNALAAAAAGVAMGVSLPRIKAGLESFVPAAGRMGIRMLNQGLCLFDDTYNANPASMVSAIKTLSRMGNDRRTIAVLGDMLELGPRSATLHRDVGQEVGKSRIDQLYVTGRFAEDVANGALKQKMTEDRIFTGSKEAIVEQLNRVLQPKDLILVKGSRGMAMETVVAAIAQWAGER